MNAITEGSILVLRMSAGSREDDMSLAAVRHLEKVAQEHDALLKALEWASRQNTVFGPTHRNAFRMMTGQQIAHNLVKHCGVLSSEEKP